MCVSWIRFIGCQMQIELCKLLPCDQPASVSIFLYRLSVFWLNELAQELFQNTIKHWHKRNRIEVCASVSMRKWNQIIFEGQRFVSNEKRILWEWKKPVMTQILSFVCLFGYGSCIIYVQRWSSWKYLLDFFVGHLPMLSNPSKDHICNFGLRN